MKYLEKIDFLSIKKNNFKKKINSKRISKKRNLIHQKINFIKKKFRLKKQKLVNNLINDIDVITREKLVYISKSDLLIINLDNGKKMGFSSSNLIKWFNNFDISELPTNPYNKQILKKSIRKLCLDKAYEYYKKSYKSNKFLINSFTLKDLIEMKNIINKLNIFEYYRNNPNKLIENYKNRKKIYKNKLINIFKNLFQLDSNDICIYCLLFNLQNIILSNETFNKIMKNYQIFNYYNEKIYEIKEKINNNYFI